MEPPLKRQFIRPNPCRKYASEQLEQYLPRVLAQLVANTYLSTPHATTVNFKNMTPKISTGILFPCREDCKTISTLKFRASEGLDTSAGTNEYEYYTTFEHAKQGPKRKRSLTFDDNHQIVWLHDHQGNCHIEQHGKTLRAPFVDEFVELAFQKVEEEMAKVNESSQRNK